MKKGMLDNDKNRMNYADGELVGGQKELDKNNDGDITGEDFAILREEREAKQEGGMMMDDQMDSICLLYTSPSPRDLARSRMPSSA